MARTRTPLPTLSAEERRRALDKAAEVRHRRSEVRKKITAGDITIKEALESSDTLITHMRVSSCLLYTSPSPRDATLSRMPSSA